MPKIGSLSRWYLRARRSPYALHFISLSLSLMTPFIWNSSSAGLANSGLALSFQGRLPMNCWIFYALFPPGDRWRDAHDSVPTGTVPVVEPPFMVVPAATLSICSYILEWDRGFVVHFTVMVAYVYALFPFCIVNMQHFVWKFCMHHIYIYNFHSFIHKIFKCQSKPLIP